MDANGVVADTHSGSSAISTSAIRLLIGPHPGNWISAALRIRLRPPSYDEISRPKRRGVGQLDVDADVALRETRDFTSAIDRHRRCNGNGDGSCERARAIGSLIGVVLNGYEMARAQSPSARQRHGHRRFSSGGP
jgi:hypothetical protein